MSETLSAKLAALLKDALEVEEGVCSDGSGKYPFACEHRVTDAAPTLIRAVQVALEAECSACGDVGECLIERHEDIVVKAPCPACAWKREMQKALMEGL